MPFLQVNNVIRLESGTSGADVALPPARPTRRQYHHNFRARLFVVGFLAHGPRNDLVTAILMLGLVDSLDVGAVVMDLADRLDWSRDGGRGSSEL